MKEKTAMKLLYLPRADVEQISLDMPAIIGLLEAAFREKGEGRVEMPPKPGIHPLALDDMAVAPEIYRRARERGIGTWLPL